MDYTEIITTIIVTIIAPCLIALTRSALAYLSASVASERLAAVLSDVDSAVATVVDSLTQTIVADIKASTIDGKLSDEDAQNILNNAISLTKNYLRVETKQYLQREGVNIGDYLADKIEAAIAVRKDGR